MNNRYQLELVGRPINLSDRLEICRQQMQQMQQLQRMEMTPPAQQTNKYKSSKRPEAIQEYFPSFNKQLSVMIDHPTPTPKIQVSPFVKPQQDLIIQVRTKSDNSRFKNESQATQVSEQLAWKLMRHNLVTMLHIIGKKDNLLEKMQKEPFIMRNEQSPFLTISQVKYVNEMTSKVIRFLTNKSRYKYRSKLHIQSSIQLVIIGYDPKKREKFQQVKSQRNYDEEDDSSSVIVKRKKPPQQSLQPMDFASWKRQEQIEQGCKVFIVKGGYCEIRDELLERGWYENPDVHSPFFDLKWTCKIQDIDYDRITDNQYVNHFDQNQTLTSKYGLCRSVRSLCWSEKVNFHQFYPRCYDLGDQIDFHDFIEDFKITKVTVTYMKCYSILHNYIANPNLNEYQQLRVRVAISVISRFNLPLQKWLHLADDFPLVQKAEWQVIRREKDKNKDQQLRDLLKKHYHTEGDFNEQYLKVAIKLAQDNESQLCLNGPRNIWIIKPDFSSRGRGIKCFSKLSAILDHVIFRDGTYVVQKYIENPLTIKKRKFDIRQWVLVQELHPPKIWFFKECYVRFSAEQLDMDNLKNKYSHLTNNSIAKNSKLFHRSEIKGNMWTQEQLANHLKELHNGQDMFYEKIQPKFKEIIIYTIKCCQDLMRARKRSFEIFGYDFMIDTSLNVWLIEVNSSPAMDYSTQITANLVPQMLTDSLKVVLDNPYRKNRKKAGDFDLIYSGDQSQQ